MKIGEIAMFWPFSRIWNAKIFHLLSDCLTSNYTYDEIF